MYFSASRQIKWLSCAIKQTLPEINQIVSYRKVMGNAKGLWANICVGWWATLSGENDADTFFYIFFYVKFYVKLLSIFTFSQNSSATIWVKKINVWKHGKQSSCSEFPVRCESSSQPLGIQCLLSASPLPSSPPPFFFSCPFLFFSLYFTYCFCARKTVPQGTLNI